MRINIFGGPGTGKSTLAKNMCSTLCKAGENVEFVQETIKSKAYKNEPILPFDQVVFFGKQIKLEKDFLDHGAKAILTEAPLELGCFYALYYGEIEVGENLLNIAKEYSKKYPSINIYLKRIDAFYKKEGRFQSLKDAKN